MQPQKASWDQVWRDIIFDENNLILIRRFVGRNTFSEFSKVLSYGIMISAIPMT